MVRRERRGPEAGAAALETALVAPVFLTLVFAIFNIGWALYCGAEVRHAVERASRLLIVDPATPLETLEEAMVERISAAEADDVTLTMATENVGASGQIARLSWTYSYEISAPFMEPARLNFDSSLVVPLRVTE